eukprot:1256956-Amphidinium_carterae.2
MRRDENSVIVGGGWQRKQNQADLSGWKRFSSLEPSEMLIGPHYPPHSSSSGPCEPYIVIGMAHPRWQAVTMLR